MSDVDDSRLFADQCLEAEANSYKLFAEHCLKLAEAAESAQQERALLEMAWCFAQLAHEAGFSEPIADDPAVPP